MFGIKLCNRLVCVEGVPKAYSVCFLVNKCSYPGYIVLMHFICMCFCLVKYSACTVFSGIGLYVTLRPFFFLFFFN